MSHDRLTDMLNYGVENARFYMFSNKSKLWLILSGNILNKLYYTFGRLDKEYLDSYFWNENDEPVPRQLKLLNYAQELMKAGDLEKAIDVVKLLDAKLRVANLEPWLRAAQHRLNVMNAIELLKFHADYLIYEGMLKLKDN